MVWWSFCQPVTLADENGMKYQYDPKEPKTIEICEAALADKGWKIRPVKLVYLDK